MHLDISRSTVAQKSLRPDPALLDEGARMPNSQASRTHMPLTDFAKPAHRLAKAEIENNDKPEEAPDN
jgi:hypothetical protein